MKVLLATAYPTKWSYLPWFRQLAARDKYGIHTLSERPDESDLIFFVDARHEHNDWRFSAIRRHRLTLTHTHKCFVYNETDQPWCSMPGLYVSMPARTLDRRRQRAVRYIWLKNDLVVSAASAIDAAGEPPHLFTFAGRICHPIRQAIMELNHPRSVLEDTTSFNFFGNANHPPEQMTAAKQQYAELIARSKFVLCPRGTGTASYRLFEALAAGRVPVIISDEWVPIDGPEWDACSVRVREADVSKIPSLVERLEARWPAMSSAAKHVWSEHFESDAIWHRMIESCADIMRGRGWLPERLRRHIPSRPYLRLLARHAKARLVSRSVLSTGT